METSSPSGLSPVVVKSEEVPPTPKVYKFLDKDGQTLLFCFFGWFVSLYALYIEFRVNGDGNSNFDGHILHHDYDKNKYSNPVNSIFSNSVTDDAIASPEYRAMCDITSYISCTSVLTSKYSRIFYALGIVPESSSLNTPNAKLGSLFYRILISLLIFSKLLQYSLSLLHQSQSKLSSESIVNVEKDAEIEIETEIEVVVQM